MRLDDERGSDNIEDRRGRGGFGFPRGGGRRIRIPAGRRGGGIGIGTIIILLILPRRNFAGRVHTLAGIAHLLENADFRTALIKASSAAEALALIEAEEDKNAHLDEAAS